MNDRIFQTLLPLVPPSSNSRGRNKKTRFKEQVTALLKDQESTEVPQDILQGKLYGRIFYFNHEKKSVRDIHNIIKPLFDALEGYVYKDDKDIIHFEGIRLDMEHNDRWFEIELNLSAVPDLQQALTKTCCYIEISELPAFPTSAVKITWL